MIRTTEIVKAYIEEVIGGNDIRLEDYMRPLFKSMTMKELKLYCKDNTIYYAPRDTKKEDIFQKIYGSCNTQIGFKILWTTHIDNETTIDLFKRIYHKEYA